MLASYNGTAYRTVSIKNMIEWFESLRFKWGEDAVFSIREVNSVINDAGMFSFKIYFKVPDGVEDANAYIRERKGVKG